MKHVSRKIMHGVLDLLPILIIGVFAIYSHRHEPTQSITYQQNELVDFNQHVNFTSGSQNTQGITFDFTSNTIIANGTATSNVNHANNQKIIINTIVNHKYLMTFNWQNASVGDCILVVGGSTSRLSYDEITPAINHKFFTATSNGSNPYSLLRIFNGKTVTYLSVTTNFYDLTQMYGAGNEPTLVSDFTDDFPLQVYPYTTSEIILNKNVSEVTYNDTDIGSQMVYALYKPIDKYFNLNKVANFEQVYDFFQVQFFNGNAPISIFIVWNIILYQFIMDVIFLVYMVFMFIIDFIGGMLDFMFRKSFGGAK